MRPRRVRRLTMVLAAAAVLTGTGVGWGIAEASATPANCEVLKWGFLGSQRRVICDGPLQADGSWMRRRIVFTPAHTTPGYSYCSGGSYSYCTYYPPQWVDDQIWGDDYYLVTPETVLRDEPGHLPIDGQIA